MKAKAKILKSPDKAIARINEISKSMNGPNVVKVGLPKNSNAYPNGTSVIMVGAVHEFGSPARNVPQRSFLRSTITENARKYKEDMKKIMKSVIDGKYDLLKGLSLLGLKVQTDVRTKITDIKEPPLKYREGNPLVDTGHLRQSIVFKVGE